MKNIYIFCLLTIGLVQASFAQGTGNSKTIFLKVAGLNTESHTALTKALAGSTEYAISYTCVPSEIIVIKILREDAVSFSESTIAKQVFAAKIITELQNYNQAQAELDCSSKRDF